MTDRQQQAAADLANEAAAKEQRLRDILEIAGINADAIVPTADAQGGPFISAAVTGSIEIPTEDAA